MKGGVSLVVVALAAAGLVWGTAQARSARQGNRPETDKPDPGYRLFVRKGCFECHGYSGQGADTGPKLAPGVLPLAIFARIVRGPPNQMPPYSSRVLSEAELGQIHAYLSSIPRNKSVDEIPQLKALAAPRVEQPRPVN
jgi:ubiquinol-cytochrome c reductase cytochrome c subunit